MKKAGCSGRRAAGVPTPAPRPGLSPRTLNFSWLANERFVCHALVVPKRWQRAKEASLCMEVCNLAHSVSSDADASRNGGMTTSGALATGARCRRGSGGTGTGSIGRGHGGDAPRYNHIYNSSEFARAAGSPGLPPPRHPALGFHPRPHILRGSMVPRLVFMPPLCQNAGSCRQTYATLAKA
jgi:hypothetical protein